MIDLKSSRKFKTKTMLFHHICLQQTFTIFKVVLQNSTQLIYGVDNYEVLPEYNLESYSWILLMFS